MAADTEPRDVWRWPLLLLWTFYLVLGAFPEDLFYLLRAFGQVTTQRAFVNSYWLVYLAWILFLAWFVVRRARFLGMELADALGRGLRVVVVAGVGFYPLRISDVLQYAQVPDPGLRYLILGFAAAKALALFLLLALLVGYCLAHRRLPDWKDG